jgi:hypothetical protein
VFVLGDLMKTVQKAAVHRHTQMVVMWMIQSWAHVLQSFNVIISYCRSDFILSEAHKTAINSSTEKRVDKFLRYIKILYLKLNIASSVFIYTYSAKGYLAVLHPFVVILVCKYIGQKMYS